MSEKKTQAAAPVEEETVKAAPKKAAPKIVKLDDTLLVTVKSNVYGQLTYTNSRTGDTTVWAHFGEPQDISMGDLRAMKGTQRAFFENQWIYIVGVVDEGYEDVTSEDIYKVLQVTQYYKNVLDPARFHEFFRWEEQKIRDHVGMLSKRGKANLVVAANHAIENGTLDSVKKIRLLEELLGCELLRLE